MCLIKDSFYCHKYDALIIFCRKKRNQYNLWFHK